MEDVGYVRLEGRRWREKQESSLSRRVEQEESGNEVSDGQARGDNHESTIGVFFEKVCDYLVMELDHINLNRTQKLGLGEILGFMLGSRRTEMAGRGRELTRRERIKVEFSLKRSNLQITQNVNY